MPGVSAGTVAVFGDKAEIQRIPQVVQVQHAITVTVLMHDYVAEEVFHDPGVTVAVIEDISDVNVPAPFISPLRHVDVLYDTKAELDQVVDDRVRPVEPAIMCGFLNQEATLLPPQPSILGVRRDRATFSSRCAATTSGALTRKSSSECSLPNRHHTTKGLPACGSIQANVLSGMTSGTHPRAASTLRMAVSV